MARVGGLQVMYEAVVYTQEGWQVMCQEVRLEKEAGLQAGRAKQVLHKCLTYSAGNM